MTEPKVWFITGTSTGFGHFLTVHLLKQGHKVVATLRKPEALNDLAAQYPPTQLLVVKLDVTQHAEVPVAFAKAKEAFGRIDVVFNNAGKMINGEVEAVNDDDARAMFEINFWGAVQVTREAVRFFREDNQPQGGRLLQVSSGLGVAGRACYGHYSASKFAIEGLTEALAHELNPAWNIKVTILVLGPFRTNLFSKAQSGLAPPHPAYTDPELPGTKWRAVFEKAAHADGDPQKACIVFEKVSQLEDPPIRLPLHERIVGVVKAKGNSLVEAAEKYKDWSADLYL